MTTINWKIQQTDYLVSDGFITTAHWAVTAVDGEYNANSYGTCSFASDTPSIPYNQVTEQEVLDWCWDNGVDKETIETSLQTQIDALKNPVKESGLPWNS